MVGETPQSPPLEVGVVAVPVPVPVALADMVVGWMGGAVGTVGGAVGTGFTWLMARGSIVEVWWVTLGPGRVGVLWVGLGGSALMAAVGWKSGWLGSECYDPSNGVMITYVAKTRTLFLFPLYSYLPIYPHSHCSFVSLSCTSTLRLYPQPLLSTPLSFMTHT